MSTSLPLEVTESTGDTLLLLNAVLFVVDCVLLRDFEFISWLIDSTTIALESSEFFWLLRDRLPCVSGARTFSFPLISDRSDTVTRECSSGSVDLGQLFPRYISSGKNVTVF